MAGVNRSYVGRSFAFDDTYEVSREKIREFAEAIGDLNPCYRDPAAAQVLGYPDVIAPPTFSVLVTRRANRRVIADSDLNLDYSRVVHGTQSFNATRPIRPGDRIRVTVHIDDIRDAGPHELVAFRSEVDTVEGEHLCTARASLIVRASEGGS